MRYINIKTNIKTRNLPSFSLAGFSLVEMMVGVAIGLIGILVVFQMLNTWDQRKRSTVAGSDAQIAGGISMFTLERDLKLAGWGFGQAPASIMGCNVKAKNSKLSAAEADVSFNLYPIEIAQGAAGVPDEIRVLYGNSAFFASARSFTQSSPSQKKTESRGGFLLGDVIIAAGTHTTPATCIMAEVTANNDTDTLSIDHGASSYTSNATGDNTLPRYNDSTVLGTAFPSGGSLFNLGPNPQRRIWSIAERRKLIWRESLNTAATQLNEVTDGIINMQAQYGVNTATSPAIEVDWTTTTPTDWTKLLAIRVGLLARSQQYEKAAVTTVNPSWAEGDFVMTNVDGSTDSGATNLSPNNWRNYRYRVYEKVIPIRNVIWGSVQ
jgi:type IV pilus assembly protein PilW